MDRTVAVACLSALLLTSCGPRMIVVGSKNFTEQLILGEILAQQIERRMKVPVERRLSLGGTLLAHEALVQGSLDLYPEYTGTALTAVLKRPPSGDAAAVLQTVRSEYQSRWKLDWLDPLGFDDGFAMIVRGDMARSDHLATLSDAAQRGPWKLGVGSEFASRPDGLPGLEKVYGLRTAGDPMTMDLGLLYAALTSGKVDMIAGNSTDGPASTLDVKILEDDRHYFPPYDCAVVVRQDALRTFKGLDETLRELSGRVSVETMRRLNHQVDGLKRPVAQVAREFLDSLH